MPVALIAGSTGLVGSHLLNLLLAYDHFSRVVAVGRRPPGMQHQKPEFMRVDFESLERVDLPHAGHVFCCLGTTMKKAGSKKQFRKVDFEYPLHLAEATLDAGAEHFYLVSSIGADKHSLFFYSRVKGETEVALEQMRFESLHIFRPSLLLGKRREKRMGEQLAGRIMKTLAPLMMGPFKPYRAIDARTVAMAMYVSAVEGPFRGRYIIEPEAIRTLAANKIF